MHTNYIYIRKKEGRKKKGWKRRSRKWKGRRREKKKKGRKSIQMVHGQKQKHENVPEIQLPFLSTLSSGQKILTGPEIIPFGQLLPTENMWLLLNVVHLFLLQINGRIGLNPGGEIEQLHCALKYLSANTFLPSGFVFTIPDGWPLAIYIFESTGVHSLVRG